MRINIVYKLATCFILSSSLVILLFLITSSKNQANNGFVRLLPPHPLTPRKIVDLQYKGFYLAGFSSTTLYFANLYSPSNLLLLNNNTFDNTRIIEIKNPTDKKIAWETTIIKVDSPDLFLLDRVTSSYIHTRLGSNVGTYSRLDTFQFTTAIPISATSVISKRFDQKLGKSILVKSNIDQPNAPKMFYTLEKQIDGFFCSDGILLYDKTRAVLTYLYYYRNQFVTLDTNLNLISNGRTIDTNSIAKINVAHISSENVYKLSSPPHIVNNKAYLSDKWLFVNSNLKAANEVGRKIKEGSSAIDLYSIKDGKYHFSFYIPPYDGRKMTNFYVTNNLLFVMYSNTLAIFDMTLPLT